MTVIQELFPDMEKHELLIDEQKEFADREF